MAANDRPSSFQPGDPHPETEGSGGSKRSVFIVAAVVALVVIMLLALGLPGLLGGNSWIAALGGGVLTFAVIVIAGLRRRSRGA